MAEDTAAPQLSIVVPAYNEAQCTAACIRSLAEQQIDCSYEVILVDNNSTDSSVAVALAAAGRMKLRVVREWRQGCGAARYTGFNLAHGQVCSQRMPTRHIPPIG